MIILSLLLIVHLQLILTLPLRTLQHHSSGGLHMFVNHNIVCNWLLVRCNDHQCCTPRRSPLQNLLPCRFLPSPVPAKHSGQGIVKSNADNAPTFLPLFVNLQLNSMLQMEKMGSSSSHHMICTVRLSKHI